MPFVADASSLAKLVVEEPGTREFRAWFQSTAERPGVLAGARGVHDAFGRVVQLNLVGRRAERPAAFHTGVLRHIQTMDPDTREVFRVAARGLTFQDASSVALADELGAALVTSGRVMARVARRLPVRTLTFGA